MIKHQPQQMGSLGTKKTRSEICLTTNRSSPRSQAQAPVICLLNHRSVIRVWSIGVRSCPSLFHSSMVPQKTNLTSCKGSAEQPKYSKQTSCQMEAHSTARMRRSTIGYARSARSASRNSRSSLMTIKAAATSSSKSATKISFCRTFSVSRYSS